MCYSLSTLTDGALARGLTAIVEQERGKTAEVLAFIAEFQARKLFLPSGFPSMYQYCVHELHLSEHAACKRITGARAARRFPALFSAVADGRLNLSTIVLLAPCLSEESADELLAAAAYKTKSQTERMLAQRFPKPDVPTSIRAVPSSAATRTDPYSSDRVALFVQVIPEVAGPSSARSEDRTPSVPEVTCQLAPGRVQLPEESSPDSNSPRAPLHVELPAARVRVVALAPQRFALQVTIGLETHDKLRRAQELLGHQLVSGDVAGVRDRALHVRK